MSAEAPLAGLQADLQRMGRLVSDQLERGLECFHARDMGEAEQLIERDDVIDNLNLSLEERCFELAASRELSADDLRVIRSTVKVAANLEHIGDAGTHIAKRARMIVRENLRPAPFEFPDLEATALQAAAAATGAFLEQDLDQARRACLYEPELDGHYVARLAEIRRRMQAYPSEVPYLLHCLSIMKYLEKVADYVLNIGEQAIFLITGRRLKFPQYQELNQLVSESTPGEFEFRPYWDGISGAVVARVDGRTGAMIYKEGSRRKIQAEAEKLKAWERIGGGKLTPRVLGSVTVKDRQALLREFVDSMLLSEFYLSGASREAKLSATQRLLDAIEVVWRTTLVSRPPRLDYVEQIRQRLPEAYALHPDLREVVESAASLGDAEAGPEDLLVRAEALQPDLTPAFSVWLHGDFNANNILYQEQTGQIQFIDVHRSRLGDYLQDVGVFLLSMDRRPGMTPSVRDDVAAANALVESFAWRFAAEYEDTTVGRRLDLSLARSCITSSRIVAEPVLAEELLRRGIGLLRRVTEEG